MPDLLKEILSTLIPIIIAVTTTIYVIIRNCINSKASQKDFSRRLDRLDTETDKNTEKFSNLSAEIKSLKHNTSYETVKGRLNDIEKDIRKLDQQINISQEINPIELSKRLTNLEENLSIINEKLESLQKIEKHVPLIGQVIGQITDEIKGMQNDIKGMQTSLNQLKVSIKDSNNTKSEDNPELKIPIKELTQSKNKRPQRTKKEKIQEDLK